METIAGKSLIAWMRVKFWCKENPEKLAAIYTDGGRFELRYIPNGNQKETPEASATE